MIMKSNLIQKSACWVEWVYCMCIHVDFLSDWCEQNPTVPENLKFCGHLISF